MPTKFQPFKGCNCKWCKGSKQHLSRSGSKNYRHAKQRLHRKLRRLGRRDPEDLRVISGDRWY